VVEDEENWFVVLLNKHGSNGGGICDVWRRGMVEGHLIYYERIS
jgi:hypothetical protein